MTARGPIHEERRDDLAAYALGALDQREAAELEEHLAACDGCRGYLEWLAPAVDLLPASVEQVEAPARLRRELLVTVRAEARAARAGAAEQKRRRGWSWGGPMLRPATVLAAFAVLVAGAVAGYALNDSSEGQRESVRASAVGDVPAAELAATVEYGAGGDAILHVQRAPKLGRGEVYKAWVSRAGAIEPGGSFRPDSDGTAEAALGDSLGGADAVLVTEEPSRHRDQPTSAPILRAELR